MVAPLAGPIIFQVEFSPGYPGFLKFCKAVGYPIADFQKVIARAVFGVEREVVAVLPRGSAKSTLAALIAVHHCVSREDPSVYIGAASRDQARVIGRIVERYARHEVVGDSLVVRHDELRRGSDTALLVVASDGGRAHGWERPTLMIGDELWQWSSREPTLLGAMTTALIKNPQATLFGISTAAASLDSPLGSMRRRALEQPTVTRRGATIDASGEGLRWLEWSVPEDADPSDMQIVKAANPAPWVGRDALTEQRRRVSEVEWLQFHLCRWGTLSARWLPPGAWGACQADYEVTDDEPLTIGIDIGGSRSASALIACVGDGEGVKVAFSEIRQGRGAVLEVAARVAKLAETRAIAEVVFDPMRFEGEAIRLERDLGLQMTEWPQSQTRMTRCSENLHRLIVEGQLRHHGDPELDRHVANAVAMPTPRGWRLTKSADDVQIDGVIALAMAAERAERTEAPAELIGWL